MSLSKGTKVVLNGISYSLCSHIQGNEQSAVWTALGPDEQEDYVIKFIKVEGEKRSRFEKEIDFCVNAKHQHIVRIYGYSEHDGCLFYIMPRYEKTLRNVINEETDPFRLLGYIVQLCNGMKYVHSNSVIHRDIKPENIFVDQTSHLVIADFGIAHFEDSTQTKAGAWMGNKRYAAPEQTDQNKSDLVSSACDIYALGRIINELYTKANPAGTQYTTISDINPLFLPLDNVVHRCLLHEPSQRPTIDDVLSDVLLIKSEIENKLEDIKEFLYPDSDTEFTESEEDDLVLQASQDLLAAQNILYYFSKEKWDTLNYSYHSNLLFSADNTIQNLCFQRWSLDCCEAKFNYESNTYKTGSPYIPINLDLPEDKALYDSVVEILSAHQIPFPYTYTDLTGKILKYFSSCCDYHCREMLDSIKKLEAAPPTLIRAPLFHIIHVLKSVLDPLDIRKIELSEHLSICWDYSTPCPDIVESRFINLENKAHIKILEQFKNRYNVIYGKIDSNRYYIRFTKRTDYDCFVAHALTLAKPHRVFEGDVLSIISIKRDSGDLIELEPLSEFDIEDTVAKILGLRDDY